MKIVFFGTPQFSANFLRALIADGDFDIVAVVTQQDELQGLKKELLDMILQNYELRNKPQYELHVLKCNQSLINSN